MTRAARPGADPATLRLRPPTWTRQAACDGHPLGPTAWDEAWPEARATCADCPVQLACARYALDNAIPEGLWGGLDPDDRAHIATNFGYLPPGTPGHGSRSRYGHRAYPCRCDLCTEAMRRWKAEYDAQHPLTARTGTRRVTTHIDYDPARHLRKTSVHIPREVMQDWDGNWGTNDDALDQAEAS